VKTVTTPSGAIVTLQEYLEAGEFLDASHDQNGKELSPKDLTNRIMQVAVTSIDGNTDDIPNRLRKIKIQDYLFLAKEVAKLIDPDFSAAKTQEQ